MTRQPNGMPWPSAVRVLLVGTLAALPTPPVAADVYGLRSRRIGNAGLGMTTGTGTHKGHPYIPAP